MKNPLMNPLVHFLVALGLILGLALGANAVATHQAPGRPPAGPVADLPPPPAKVLFVGPSPSDDGTEYLMVMLVSPNTTVIGRISTVEVWQRFKLKNGQLDVEGLRKEMRAALLRLLEGKHAPSI